MQLQKNGCGQDNLIWAEFNRLQMYQQKNELNSENANKSTCEKYVALINHILCL